MNTQDGKDNDSGPRDHCAQEELDPLKLLELRRKEETCRHEKMAYDHQVHEDVQQRSPSSEEEHSSSSQQKSSSVGTKAALTSKETSKTMAGNNDDSESDDMYLMKIVQARASSRGNDNDGNNNRDAAAGKIRTKTKSESISKMKSPPHPALAEMRSGKDIESDAVQARNLLEGKGDCTQEVVGSAHTNASEPGAYAESPGPDMQRPNTSTALGLVMEEVDASQSSNDDSDGTGSASGVPSSRLGDPEAQEGDLPLLTVARAVSSAEQPSHMNLPMAEHYEQKRVQEQQNKELRACLTMMAWVGAGIVIVVAIVLVVTFTVSGNNNNNAPSTIAPSISPTIAPTDTNQYILSMLPSYTLEALELQDSPQARAYEWLMEDPSLSEYPEWRVLQRYALATFFYALGGPDSWYNTTNWLSYDHHECSWFSSESDCYECQTLDALLLENGTNFCGPNFTTNDPNSPDGQFLALWLNWNGLRGPVPQEITLLTSLVSLQLQVSQISGTLPIEIPQRMTNLARLDFSVNKLVGTIHTEIFAMPNLIDLGLHGNQLTGTIPTEIGLANLVFVLLEENSLTGTLPSEISNNQQLRHFFAEMNSLSGSIPSEFGALGSLQWIMLSGNQFTSTIPSEIGNLHELFFFDVSLSLLSGSIPSELGRIAPLDWLQLERCLLSSTVPSEVWQLANLYVLNVHGNQVSGTIPTEIGVLQHMEHLYLDDNLFSSTMPTEIGKLTLLRNLFLSSNAFSGPIPSELGVLSMLEVLWLQNNSLTGTVPLELALNTSEIGLDNNLLSGVIPENLCRVDVLTFDCSADLLCGCDCNCSTVLPVDLLSNQSTVNQSLPLLLSEFNNSL